MLNDVVMLLGGRNMNLPTQDELQMLRKGLRKRKLPRVLMECGAVSLA